VEPIARCSWGTRDSSQIAREMWSTSPASDTSDNLQGLKKCMSLSIPARMSRARVLRKCVGKPFVLVNEWVWNRLPSSVTTTRPMCVYGTFLHFLVKLRSARRQYYGTFFLRNRPELELIRDLSNQRTRGSTLRVCVLACSNGAEVYSILWTIRSARPDLKVIVNAVDISPEILEIAKKGLYSLEGNELVNSPIFERLTEQEMRAMFDREEDHVKIKSWIKEGINWHAANAGDPELAAFLGPQDIVVANRFLCHMPPADAEKCLRNLARLVNPGGYLFVSGVDLDIRSKVVIDLGWSPVCDLIHDIHDGDCSLRNDWPWQYWGLEPFNRRRRDWKVRYAAVFQLIGEGGAGGHVSKAHQGGRPL
jgi:SAM-dependent methyltransferase